jgi:hypothetical protein
MRWCVRLLRSLIFLLLLEKNADTASLLYIFVPFVESLQSHFILTMSHWSSGLPVFLVTRDPGSNPQGGTNVKPGFSYKRCLATLVTLTWLIIMASSEAGFVPKTITRPSCRQCDNPTWSHTAFLSRFHTRCRSPLRLHNRRSQLMGGSPVQSLQSHFILTMSQWSSGLPVCFPSQGTQAQIPWGVLMWNRNSPVSDVSLHVDVIEPLPGLQPVGVS